MKEYLETLQQKGFIEYETERRCYLTTVKGIQLLQLQDKLQQVAPIHYVSLKIAEKAILISTQ